LCRTAKYRKKSPICSWFVLNSDRLLARIHEPEVFQEVAIARAEHARRREIAARLRDAAQTCSEHGAQLTELRGRVLTLILEAEHPMTAYQLLDRLRKTHANPVPPTIYRALEFLMQQGLVHKIERLNAFVVCQQSDHGSHVAQFLICRACGTVAEIDDGAVASAVQRAAENAGFRSGGATIEIEGTCAACSDSG